MARQFFLGLLLALVLVAGMQPARAATLVGPTIAACNPIGLNPGLVEEVPVGLAESENAASESDQSLQFDGIESFTFALAAEYAGRPSIVWENGYRANLIAPDPYPPRPQLL
jgi:hypothetical protein